VTESHKNNNPNGDPLIGGGRTASREEQTTNGSGENTGGKKEAAKQQPHSTLIVIPGPNEQSKEQPNITSGMLRKQETNTILKDRNTQDQSQEDQAQEPKSQQWWEALAGFQTTKSSEAQDTSTGHKEEEKENINDTPKKGSVQPNDGRSGSPYIERDEDRYNEWYEERPGQTPFENDADYALNLRGLKPIPIQTPREAENGRSPVQGTQTMMYNGKGKEDDDVINERKCNLMVSNKRPPIVNRSPSFNNNNNNNNQNNNKDPNKSPKELAERTKKEETPKKTFMKKQYRRSHRHQTCFKPKTFPTEKTSLLCSRESSRSLKT
jgi:hypothetical protein